MEKKIWLNLTIYDFRKLFWASVIIFLMLILTAKKVDIPTTMIQVDYLKEEQKEKNTEHPSPTIELISSPLDRLCSGQETFCKKVIYTWGVNFDDKIRYTSEYLSIIWFIEKHLMKGTPVSIALKSYIINWEPGKRRWGATAERIRINLASLGAPEEYWGVSSHEFWHVVDLWALRGLSKYKDQNYTEFGKVKFSVDDSSLEYYRLSWDSESIRKETSEEKDFCSRYWMTNPFEDFAECHNLYLNNRQLFKTMTNESWVLRQKYLFLANLFDNQVIQEGKSPLLYAGWRPWDTTVLY